MLKYNDIPQWIVSLSIDDLDFVKKNILYSGSLKELAVDYKVTYPTIRLKLDKLIEKINSSQVEVSDEYIDKIKSLALEDKIDIEVAKELIRDYRIKCMKKIVFFS